MIELQVLNYVLETGDASLITANNLKSEYFIEYSAAFVFIKNYIDKYGKAPTKETFLEMFNIDFTGSSALDNPGYLVDKLIENYRYSSMVATLTKVSDNIKKGDVKGAYKIYVDGVEALGSEVAITGTNLFEDFSRYDDYLNKSANIEKYYVSTGFKELDDVMFGIDRREELGVIMARTNMGKSYITLKMAIESAKKGLRVGLYSGEMTSGKVGYRMDALISGEEADKYKLNCGYLMHGNTYIKDDYKRYFEDLKKNYPDSFLLVFTPADAGGSVTVDTMRAYIEKYKLDILFIDQLSLMDDKRRGKSREERQSNIIIDLKKLQVQKELPIICVAQQNRTKNEDDSIDTTQIAGTDDIGKYATFVLAISRDKKDKQVMIMEVTKCRDGKAGSKVKYYADLSMGTFQYIPEDDNAAKPTLTLQPKAEVNPQPEDDIYDDSGGDVF